MVMRNVLRAFALCLLLAPGAVAQEAAEPSEPSPSPPQAVGGASSPSAAGPPIEEAPPPDPQAAPPQSSAAAPQPDAPIARELTVGVQRNAPGFSVPGEFGLRTGFDVDVALAICERINARCQLVALPADDVFAAVADRRVALAFAAGAPRGASDEQLLFSNPYLELVQRFVLPRVLLTPTEREKGVVRGALAGTVQGAYLSASTSDPDTVILYPDTDGMWVDLSLGRLNAALVLGLTGRRDFLATPLGDSFRFSDGAYGLSAGPAISVSAAVRPGERALLADINTAIDAFVASAEYTVLLAQYLDADLARHPTPPAPSP